MLYNGSFNKVFQLNVLQYLDTLDEKFNVNFEVKGVERSGYILLQTAF
jgi:hypothetical protein